jgi:ABC-type cobalt transport system substrate-binding protein
MFRRRGAFILIAFASLFVTSGALAQTVVSRARLGNMIEDITYVSNGRLAGSLAFMNGYELLLSPLHPQGGPKAQAPLTKLFDIRSTDLTGTGRGLVYIPSEKLFAFHPASSGDLYLVDENGVFRGTRTMVFPGAPTTYAEGMDYLPRSSPYFPDHLIMIANWFADGDQNPRIEVVRRDGTVEAEIAVHPFGLQPDGSYLFDPANTLLGLAYVSPDRLLVTINDGTNNIWELDFTGHVVGTGPVWAASGMTNFEGIVQVTDGRVAATEFATGITRFFDRRMNRLPDQDRTYSVGFGVTRASGLAWDSDTHSHLVLSQLPTPRITTVARTLDSALAAPLVPNPPNTPNRLTYISDDGLAATWIRHANPGGSPNFMTFYDPSTGQFDSELNFANQATARSLEYIPTADRFAIVFGAQGNAPVLITERPGIPVVKQIDISATGVHNPLGIAYFAPSDPSGGRLLLADGVNTAVIDLNGNVLPGGFNIREKLNLLLPVDISAITTGPQAGAFAIIDSENSELVVFTLP